MRKYFEEKNKKDKYLPDPGANSKVYILNLLHRFANALFFCRTKPLYERGVTRQCVRAVRTFPASHSLNMARTACWEEGYIIATKSLRTQVISYPIHLVPQLPDPDRSGRPLLFSFMWTSTLIIFHGN